MGGRDRFLYAKQFRKFASIFWPLREELKQRMCQDRLLRGAVPKKPHRVLLGYGDRSLANQTIFIPVAKEQRVEMICRIDNLNSNSVLSDLGSHESSRPWVSSSGEIIEQAVRKQKFN